MIRTRDTTIVKSAAGNGSRFCRAGFMHQFLVVATVYTLCGFLSVRAQDSKPREYEVKAAYLYNFGKFVQWPTETARPNSDSFSICVLGQDPFGPILDSTIAGELIEGKAVVARRISHPRDAVECRVLFVSVSEEWRLKEILPTLHKASVLTVSDIRQFTRRGGMIQFTLEGNRVRFEVNLTPAQEAGLILSSDLLKVAVAVRRQSLPGE